MYEDGKRQDKGKEALKNEGDQVKRIEKNLYMSDPATRQEDRGEGPKKEPPPPRQRVGDKGNETEEMRGGTKEEKRDLFAVPLLSLPSPPLVVSFLGSYINRSDSTSFDCCFVV